MLTSRCLPADESIPLLLSPTVDQTLVLWLETVFKRNDARCQTKHVYVLELKVAGDVGQEWGFLRIPEAMNGKERTWRLMSLPLVINAINRD